MTAGSEQGGWDGVVSEVSNPSGQNNSALRKHDVGHREPYSVFTVLRGEIDESNLHSRSLVALLAKDL